MGRQLELRCRPISCVIFFAAVLVHARGSRGSDLSPSSQVASASPFIGTQASSPMPDENSRTTIPSSAPTSNGDLPPKMSPPKDVSMAPRIQNTPPSILPSPFPEQVPSEHGDSSASIPSIGHYSMAPALAAPSVPPISSVSPVYHGGNWQSAAPSSEISPVHHLPVRGFVPTYPSVVPAPVISHSPPSGQPPVSSPTRSNDERSNPRNSSFPSTVQAPMISPLPSPKSMPRNHSRDHVHPPIVQGPSPMQSLVPSVGAKPSPVPVPSYATPFSRSHGPIISPMPSVDIPFYAGIPTSSSFRTSPVAPSNQYHQSVSPSGSPHLRSGNPSLPPAKVLPPSLVPVPQPKKALPPSPTSMTQPRQAFPSPPPELDCATFTCVDPLTNSPPGPSCACVLPVKVELRLGVELYTFLPLLSELAQEIALGTSMKQSQVRVMGANAATEQPQKTIVLVDLVPLGKVFDKTTSLSIAKKFWHKQVGIKVSYFGDYDVLYVIYPGLPPPPPMPPGNINLNGGSENNSRRIHPLGVDVKKKRRELGGSLIAIIVLSSVIAFVLSVGVAWFLFSKPSNGAQIARHASVNSLPLVSKASGIGPAVLRSHPSSASGSFTSSIATYTGSAKTFTTTEIERATNNFEDSNIIGEGGFGRVYQGILEDETKIAVKVIKRDGQQGSREFLAEVEMLSRLHHRNLVKLIGICTEEHLRCLVYELIPNGSVDSHLHGSDKEVSPLDWGTRIKIGLGAARGLAYLHEDSSPRVIHRDFKSSNILLEYDFTPKVSDFGLARTALDEGNGHISTRVMGTFGYVAPEYAMTGHLLVKSDVYSYGVVLLELLTGRKPVDMLRPAGQENLVTWARPLLTSKEGLETILDPALCSNVPFDSVAKVAAIASMCVQPEVSHRPFMGEVVQALKLVCNESDEHVVSGGCSQGDATDQNPELSIGIPVVPGTDRVLSTCEIFRTSATLTREVSGSFRRHSSSGPLQTNSSSQFWKKLRGLSRGSMSETRIELGPRTGGEGWP